MKYCVYIKDKAETIIVVSADRVCTTGNKLCFSNDNHKTWIAVFNIDNIYGYAPHPLLSEKDEK
jgi:hypothetical protein